jgi:phosphate transporter
MGGIALGKAVDSSGLLQIMGVMIRDSVQGLPMYEVVLVLGFVVMVRAWSNSKGQKLTGDCCVR